MQDRYVGDVGDFAKYGLLRAIGGTRSLGVAWYLHPDAGRPGDGRYTEYLKRREEWRHLDCELFDILKKIVALNERSVAAVQERRILGNAKFADQRLCIDRVPLRCREGWRRKWFDGVKETLSNCDLVFADPDNGLFSDERFRPTQKRSAKSIPLYEAKALAEKDRPVVIYHHNTMRKGGHCKEIRYWMGQLPGCIFAWYWRRWSNRTFFIVNPDGEMTRKLHDFKKLWGECGDLMSK